MLATVAALFVATLVHAALGFGTALVAMPLLAVTVGVRTATPLVGLVVLTTVAVLLAWTWRGVDVTDTPLPLAKPRPAMISHRMAALVPRRA